MENTDEKINETQPAADRADGTLEQRTAEPEAPAAPPVEAEARGEGIGSIVGFAVKAVAVALSFVLVITCMLAVIFPLRTMHIMNDLGMSARAVDFGERYISRELKSYGADAVDSNGDLYKLGLTPKLSNSDMLDALYVCTDLSYKMMNDYYKKGDTALGEYYAVRVEKYTRIYSSLNDIEAINYTKSEKNVISMPSAMLRPVVYSYGQTVRAMNFRARTYLNKTDKLLYHSREHGKALRSTDAEAIFFTAPISAMNRATLIGRLDDFADYMAEISEYLDVEFLRAGVINDLSKTAPVLINGETQMYPVLSEGFVSKTYKGKISGDRFALMFNPLYDPAAGDNSRDNVFSNIYLCLETGSLSDQSVGFTDYAQAATDFVPGEGGGDRVDEQLHRLYWLNTFNKVSKQLWYMQILLNYSSENFGQRSTAIEQDYMPGVNVVCENYTKVRYQGRLDELGKVYTEALAEYMQNYNRT